MSTDATANATLSSVAGNISSITKTLNHDFNWTLLYVYIPMLSMQLWLIIALLGRMIKHLTGQELSLSTMVCELERLDMLIAKSVRKLERRGGKLPIDVEKGVEKGVAKNFHATAAGPPKTSISPPRKASADTESPDGSRERRKTNPLLPLSPLHSQEKEMPQPTSLLSSVSSVSVSTASSSSIIKAPPPTSTKNPYIHYNDPLSLEPSQNSQKQIDRHTPNWEVFPGDGQQTPPLSPPQRQRQQQKQQRPPPRPPAAGAGGSSFQKTYGTHFLMPPSLSALRGVGGATAAAAAGGSVGSTGSVPRRNAFVRY